ncbi:MAG TPA: ATP-binding protein, partial [Rhodocyclaceae bacterium]|nr:ATP-binding protein [Rhodocyclaceae bacterium]
SPVVPEVLRSKVMVFVQLFQMQRRTRFLAEQRVAYVQAKVAREAAEETTRRSNFLSRASRELSTSLDLNASMRRLVELIVPQLAQFAVLLIDMDDEPNVMLVRACAEDDGHSSTTQVLRPYAGLPAFVLQAFDRAIQEGRSIELTLTANDSEAASRADSDVSWRHDLKTLLIVPMHSGERSLGVLAFGNILAPPAYTPPDLATIEELASRAAIAFENARLYRSLQGEIVKSRQAEERLQDSNRRKDEFLAMLSHELRNPLAPIRNAVEVIRRVAPPEPSLTWARDVVDRQVSHLARLIEELLDVSRISQGKISLRKEAVELSQIIAHGIETARPLIEARGHKLTVNTPASPVWLMGDFARLAQVVANLLNNAAKYTPDGGIIELESSLSNDEATIAVRDNGIGISPNLLPRIFELFAQGERSLDRSQGGLGVGLTLVRRLVEQHQGHVLAASDGDGKGAEIKVFLPCMRSGVARTTLSATERPQAACGSARVLVIDDNADTAESVAVFLRLEGHEVIAAADGLHALTMARSFLPDVAIIDIGLPGLSGYEVASRLRATPEYRNMLLVALTGYGQKEDQQLASQAGFDHHFVKPMNPQEILNVIASHIAPDDGATLYKKNELCETAQLKSAS